jgi:hypothetical protein
VIYQCWCQAFATAIHDGCDRRCKYFSVKEILYEGRVRGVHVEVDFACGPLIVDFSEECRDEAEEGSFVGEKGSDAGAALEFKIDAFDGIAGAESALVGGREGEDGEALGDIFLHPSGESGCGLGVGEDEVFEAFLSGGQIWGVEDGADV